MSIQPLDQVYIVANFKETQLADLEIGRPVQISVDAYPGRSFAGAYRASLRRRERPRRCCRRKTPRATSSRSSSGVPVRIDLTEPNPRRRTAVCRDVGRARGRHQGRAGRPGRRSAAAQPWPRLLLRRRPADEYRLGFARPDRPADQPVDHRPDRDAGDLHGSARHVHRQRRSAAYRRQPVRFGPREHLGLDQLSGRQRRHPAAVRLALDRSSAASGFISRASSCSRPARHSAAWRPASSNWFSSASSKASPAAACSPPSRRSSWTPSPSQSGAWPWPCTRWRSWSPPFSDRHLGDTSPRITVWRWIFYINLPVGVLAVVLSSIVLRDPPYLTEQRAARKGKPFQMDFIGLGLLSLGLASLELMLDKGQEHDWFDSHFIVVLARLLARRPGRHGHLGAAAPGP